MITRYKNFDWLRGLAIVAVILIHITAPMSLDGDIGSVLLNQMTRFGVPVFVFLSGWGLTITNRYAKSGNYIEFMKQGISKLLPSYLIWNVIYFAYQWLTEIERIPMRGFIKGIVFGTNFPHLYFVPLIILFYLFYPMLLKIGRYKTGVFLALIINLASQIITWGHSVEGFTRDHNPLNWLFYFVLGIWVATHFDEYRQKIITYKKPILFSTGIMTIFILIEPFLHLEGETTGQLILLQTRPSVILYSTLIILWMSAVSLKSPQLSNYLNRLSKDSYDLYLSHYLFVRILRHLYLETERMIPSVLYIALMFILVLFCSYALIGIQKKIGQV